MESTNTPGWIVSRVLQDPSPDFQPLAELNDDPSVKEALRRLYSLPPDRMLKMARLFTTLADDFEEALELSAKQEITLTMNPAGQLFPCIDGGH